MALYFYKYIVENESYDVHVILGSNDIDTPPLEEGKSRYLFDSLSHHKCPIVNFVRNKLLQFRESEYIKDGSFKYFSHYTMSGSYLQSPSDFNSILFYVNPPKFPTNHSVDYKSEKTVSKFNFEDMDFRIYLDANGLDEVNYNIGKMKLVNNKMKDFIEKMTLVYDRFGEPVADKPAFFSFENQNYILNRINQEEASYQYWNNALEEYNNATDKNSFWTSKNDYVNKLLQDGLPNNLRLQLWMAFLGIDDTDIQNLSETYYRNLDEINQTYATDNQEKYKEILNFFPNRGATIDEILENDKIIGKHPRQSPLRVLRNDVIRQYAYENFNFYSERCLLNVFAFRNIGLVMDMFYNHDYFQGDAIFLRRVIDVSKSESIAFCIYKTMFDKRRFKDISTEHVDDFIHISRKLGNNIDKNEYDELAVTNNLELDSVFNSICFSHFNLPQIPTKITMQYLDLFLLEGEIATYRFGLALAKVFKKFNKDIISPIVGVEPMKNTSSTITNQMIGELGESGELSNYLLFDSDFDKIASSFNFHNPRSRNYINVNGITKK